jgi:hypothetical protein
VATLARHFDVFAASFLAELSAILLAGWHLTKARDMSALFLFLIGHFDFSSFQVRELQSVSYPLSLTVGRLGWLMTHPDTRLRTPAVPRSGQALHRGATFTGVNERPRSG